ncbi:MAG TPA: M23 family metallopeptidase [Treponema sp.]|nr:M23 family metallopeptidase [Treponema sp.]
MRFGSPIAVITTFFVLIFSLVQASSHEQSPYPEITELLSGNPVFRQYQDDILAARMAIAAGKPATLHIYRYRVRSTDTLLGIAARCSLPYDAIVSLNRIESVNTLLDGKMLYLPSIPALYLHDNAENPLENLILSSFDPSSVGIISFLLRINNGPPQQVHCLPEASFDGTVRAFFLTPTFRFPLPAGRVTSSFGMRKNPLTGNLIFHHGVDLAAPEGTPVFACADGTITVAAFHEIYGNYIILRHEGNRESLYGHLRTIKIELHDKIKSGTIIGIVGSTGQSTGPHLHFEIHENGVPKNPAGFLKRN